MSHAADAVLAAFVALLQNIPGLEDHVTTDEEKIAKIEDLPWAWPQLGNEDITSTTLDRKKSRQQLINVDLITTDRFAAMAKANEKAALIEDRIDGDPRLGGIVHKVELRSIERSRSDEQPVARLRMIFAVTYRTAAGAASTPL